MGNKGLGTRKKIKKTWRQERHLYVFECSDCKKPRAQSFRRSVARLGLCRDCRKGKDLNPNQMTIIGYATE